jgi:hypothetical protein
MKPGETLRFECGDCQIVFDLSVRPEWEWAETFEHDDESEIDVGVPIHCPFCGRVVK